SDLEGIVTEKATRAGVVVEELPNQVHRPGLALRDRHGREPDLPVDTRLVGRDDAGPARRIAGLAEEFVGLPARRLGYDLVARSFEDDLAALPSDGTEGAVGVDEVQRGEGRVHDLARRDEVHDRIDAEQRDDG